jgi:hypothetical protein
MSAQPIRETRLAPNRGSLAIQNTGLPAYLIPRQTCATCGKPTCGRSDEPGPKHVACERDDTGRLLVVGGET